MTRRAETLLITLRDHLAAVPGVATCKVGLEDNIAPTDHPIVRIVPYRLTPDQMLGRRHVDALVYFGQAVTDEDRVAGYKLMALRVTLRG